MEIAAQCFRTESELVEYAIPLLSRHFGSEFDISTEVAVGRSVADVVLVFPRQGRISTAYPLTVTESVVLSTLRSMGRSTRIDILESRCGLNRRELRNGGLDRLVDERLVQMGRGGKVSSRAFSRWAKILAFEAKLEKWRSALRQAVTYRSFADLSYVLIPSENAKHAIAQIDSFRSSGVGLLTVEENAIKTHARAVRSYDHNWKREYLVSRLL